MASPTPTKTIPWQDLKDIFKQLNAVDANISPLKTLQRQMEVIFSHGEFCASIISPLLVDPGMRIRNTEIQIKKASEVFDGLRLRPWNCNGREVSKIVLTLASRPNPKLMHQALQFNSSSMGGLITLEEIHKTPSASFDEAYQKAKVAALSPSAKTTVVCVQLVDAHMIEQVKNGNQGAYTSFGICFSVAVGPEGVIIWQSWGMRGCNLVEYLACGGACVRTWTEAEKFTTAFQKLANGVGTMNYDKYRWYKLCFGIDLKNLCKPKGPLPPISPKYEPWVKLMVLEDVKQTDVLKFQWVDNSG